MNELLVTAVILLWVLVIVLAVMVFALARQIGVLYERVAPAGALSLNQSLSAGDAAPEVSVRTLQGESRTAGRGERGAQLLFFLSPDCPICKSLLPVLKTLQRDEPQVEVLLLSDGEEDHEGFVSTHQLQNFDYAVSEIAGRTFGVSKLPYGVLVGSDHKIASLGIINSREHLESLFEAQRMGVGTVQEYLHAANE